MDGGYQGREDGFSRTRCLHSWVAAHVCTLSEGTSADPLRARV